MNTSTDETMHSQPLEALAIANDIRLERARLRRRVHALKDYREGCCELADLLESGPAGMHRLRVGHALFWVHRMNEARLMALLSPAWAESSWERISPWRMVGELTSRQRSMLVSRLRNRRAS